MGEGRDFSPRHPSYPRPNSPVCTRHRLPPLPAHLTTSHLSVLPVFITCLYYLYLPVCVTCIAYVTGTSYLCQGALYYNEIIMNSHHNGVDEFLRNTKSNV